MRNIIIIIVLVVLIATLAFVFIKKDKSVDSNTNSNETVSELNDSDVVVEPVDNSNNNQNATSTGIYVDYDPSLLAQADSGQVVLFFNAPWCPTCKFLDKNLNSQLTNLPNGLAILKLNYDRELELKEKYNIVIQHTLVQVDAQGNEISKWTGGNDLASIIEHLK